MEILGSSVATGLVHVGLIAIGVGVIVISRYCSGQHRRSSDGLWNELRHAHKLSWLESRRLRKAADKAGLDPLSLLFVEPHILQQAIDAAGRESSAGKELSRLADHLYA